MKMEFLAIWLVLEYSVKQNGSRPNLYNYHYYVKDWKYFLPCLNYMSLILCVFCFIEFCLYPFFLPKSISQGNFCLCFRPPPRNHQIKCPVKILCMLIIFLLFLSIRLIKLVTGNGLCPFSSSALICLFSF